MQLEPAELKLVFSIEVTFRVNERKAADIFQAYVRQAAEEYEREREGFSLGMIQMSPIIMQPDEMS